jgi:hypothetical protein
MFKSTIVLALLALGLWGVYNFYLKENEINVTNDEPRPSAFMAIDLVNLELTMIDRVEWVLDGIESLEVKKNGENWELSRPGGMELDQTKVQNFVESVSSLSGQTSIPLTELSLNDAGLASPKLKMVVSGSEGQREVLLFGDLTVGESTRYLHKEGTDYITVIYDYLYQDLAIRPADLGPNPSPSPEVSTF